MTSHVAIASNRRGLGSMPYPASSSTPAGTTFRVWAPFAPWVHVIGSFNGWSVSATPLAREHNGFWSADVEGGKVGDTYRYVLGDAEHTRVDPRALDVTHSAGNGIVWQSTYKWQTQSFWMPAWNELVIYELHPSTFPKHPRPDGQVLAGIARDLTDLRDLGINAIELMPLKEFPGDNSWGYNPVHMFAIEESYGGPDALKHLVDTAHGLGIAVILDVIYQHFGNREAVVLVMTRSSSLTFITEPTRTIESDFHAKACGEFDSIRIGQDTFPISTITHPTTPSPVEASTITSDTMARSGSGSVRTPQLSCLSRFFPLRVVMQSEICC